MNHEFARVRTVLLLAAFFGCVLASASAQTATSWIPGNGSWSDAAKWTNGVPNSPSADAYVDNQPGTNSVVSLNNSVTVGRLRIDAGDRVDTGNTGTLSVNVPSNGFAGAGELLLNGTFAMPSNFTNGAGHSLQGNGITINGTGSLVLGSASGRVYVGTDITNNATIQGTAQFGVANSNRYRTINNGTIDANISGALLAMQSIPGANRSVNNGTMGASNGGQLAIGQGEWVNAGTMQAVGPNSLLAFYRGGLLEGGTLGILSASGGGKIQIGGSFDGSNGGHTFKNVTNTPSAPGGAFEVIETLHVQGSFTNNGTVTIKPSGRIETEALPALTTLNGNGTTIVERTDDTTAVGTGGSGKLLIQDQTIRGQGLVGYYRRTDSHAMEITNRGTIQADRSQLTLRVEAGELDNQTSSGKLRAIDGGRLTLSIRGTLKNTGGTIEALNGGIVDAGEGVRVEGGVIRNVGGSIPLNKWTIVNPTGPGSDPAVPLDPNGMILEGVLTLGAAGANENATLVGHIIKNSGTLRVASSGDNYSRLILGEAATSKPHLKLTGGGQVILGTFANGTVGNDNARMFENLDPGPQGWAVTRDFHNFDNTIRGFGGLGWDPGNYGNFMHLINSGTIVADVPNKTLTVRLRSGVNNSTIGSANGGRLDLFGDSFDNTNGFLEARNTSPFTFFGSTAITGGTLRNIGASSTAVNFDLAGATLVNLTLQGPFIVRNTGQAGMVGAIQNEGTVQLLNSSSTRTKLLVGSSTTNSLTLGGTVANPGEIILGDAALGGSEASVEAGPNTSAPLLTLNQNLHGFGRVGYDSSTARGMNLINNADIAADVAGKELRVVPFNLTNSPGKTLRATNGGQLYLHPLQLTNTNATISAANASTLQFNTETTVTGGTVSSALGGKIQVLANLGANGGVSFNNAGTLEFGQSGGSSFNGLANGGSSIVNSGTIRKLGSADYSVYSPLTNTGTINVNNTGAISVQSGVLRWRGGAAVTNSNLSTAAGTHLTFQDAPVTFSGLNRFTGSGNLWAFDVTATLADPETQLIGTNFNLGNTTLTGPGTVTLDGGLTVHPFVTTTISGAQLFTKEGSSSVLNKRGALFQFTNGANWVNSGLISMISEPGRNDGVNRIDGAAGTSFTNTRSGILRSEAANENRLRMPYLNQGTFEAAGGILRINANGKFEDGTVKAAQGQSVRFENVAVSLKGTNLVTGLGTMESFGVAMTFDAGAKLNVENGVPGAGFGIHDGSTVTGGEINLSKDFGFHNYTGIPQVFRGGAKINTGSTATGRIEQNGGITRFENAHLKNGGLFDIRLSPTIELNSGAIFENNGELRIYNSPTFVANDNGLLKTGFNSKTRFYTSRTMSWPFDCAGEIYAENGTTATFDKGGLFNETAKIWPNHPNSRITFTGSTPYQSRGRAVEFPGTGHVNFDGTTLEFLPSSIAGDETDIDAGARITFRNNNVIKSTGTQGKLNSSGFVFESGDQTVQNTILETSGPDETVWNATNKRVLFNGGATFRNGARFVIQSAVGSLGFPGFSGEQGALFHNLPNGRLIHDTNTSTAIDMDFFNEGFLEFRAGTFSFLKRFSGRGGIAASNGGRVTLSLVGVPLDQQPQQFQILGAGSGISVNLAPGQTLAASISSNGGQLVAAGGLNMVAAGGLNMVAAGGGNIVAAGGMNMVAAGGGNITANGAGSFINANSLIGTDGSTLIGTDGASLLARLSALISSSTLIGTDGSTLIGTDGGSLIGTDGSTLIGTDGSSLIARGGNLQIGGAASSTVSRDSAGLGRSGELELAAGDSTAQAPRSLDELTGKAGLDAKIAAIKELNTQSGASMLYIDAASNATVQGGGSIVAQNAGVIMGSGTFNGPGVIETGGQLRPGSSAGVMTWNGNLNVQPGGLLEIEIAGTTPGTQHDRLNVSGTCTMNGNLSVRFLNGFGGAVQQAQSFDVVRATGGITTSLAGNRISVFGATGTFLVQLVDNNTTLRLTDYQPGAVTFSNWAAAYGLSGAAAAPTADPNNNGLPNLLEYALGLDPTAVGGPRGISSGILEENGVKYLTLSYTRPTGAETRPDITYTPERATSVLPNAWSSADIVLVGTSPGPGSLETVTVRSTHPVSATVKEFLRLTVSTTP